MPRRPVRGAGAIGPTGAARSGAVGAVVLLAASLLPALRAQAQESAIPTVGDSPTALQLCRRAEDLRDSNPIESARLVQRILGEYGDRLVAVEAGGDRFAPASQRAAELLRGSPKVLEAWREIMAPTVERLVDEGRFETLARIAPLTSAGADAILRLAQRDLEAGRPASALSRLRGFDEAQASDARSRAFALAMRFRAASLVGASSIAAQAREQLDRLSSEDPSVAPIAAASRDAGDSSRRDPVDATALDRSPSWPRIWRLPLPNSPYSRRYLNPADGPLLTVPSATQALDDGSLLTVEPLADGDRVYLSEGQVVTAIDRLSRRVRWRRSLSPAEDLDVSPIADSSRMTIAGDMLILLSGHGAEKRRTGAGRVVALDLETGEPIWERSLASLELADPDGSDGLFPHGAAVVVDDTVVVMGRKVNARQESVATLVGLELATGRPRWTTYLAGCGSRPMSNMRAFSDPVVHDGAIFVASTVGATARIEPSTGTIRWLVRTAVPVTDITAPPLPWENGSPVPTPQGLLAISPDQKGVMLLDAEDGALKRTMTLGRGEAWGVPRYLVGDRDGVRILAVGDDVLFFDADSTESLDRPRWSLSAGLAQAGIGPGKARIRGRLSFVDGVLEGRPAVLVPLADRIVIVDSNDGRVVRGIETGRPGLPLLAGGQLLHAGADRLDCYMPLAGAEKAIRDWMARDPNDATRAMALLELGIQCGVAPMIFEGASTAVAALDRADDDAIRSEVVERMLACAVVETELPDPDARRLLALAQRASRRAVDRVRCALAEGDWELRRGRAEAAIDSWQRILASQELRSTDMVASDSTRPAAAMALSRMAAALAAHGPSALAARERAADAALRALGAQPHDEELASHARTWMGSGAAAGAAIGAAEALAAAGAPREAFGLLAESLRQRSRLAGVDGTVRPLISSLASLAASQRWQTAAGAELLSLLDRSGRAPGASQEDTNTVVEAIRSLDPANPAARAMPSLGSDAGTGRQRPARLPRHSVGAESERPLDRVLLVERSEKPGSRSQMTLRDGRSLEEIWHAPIQVDDPEVLAFGDDVLLWQQGAGQEPSLLSLSAADGSIRWVVPSVVELFDRSRAGVSSFVGRRGTRDLRSISPQEIVALRADPWIVLARRNGDLAAIDRRDGSTRWRRDAVAEELPGALGPRGGQVAAGGMFVAVGSARRAPGGTWLPQLTILDAATGRTISSIDLPVAGEVDWVSIVPGPLVLACVRNTIFAFEPGSSKPLWVRTDHRVGGGMPGLAVQDSLMLVVLRPNSRREEFLTIDLLDGSIDAERFVVPPRRGFGASQLQTLQRLDDSVVAGFSDRVVLFDAQGRTLGQDAVAAEHSYTHVLPSREMLVTVDPSRTFLANPDRVGASQPSAVLYFISRREGGRLVAEPIAVPIGDQTADRWLLLDGAIVGSGLDWTTVVPFGRESPR